MTKAEFLAALDAALAQLPPEERRKALDYYDEMLADRMEDGMTEEEAVGSMEPVGRIAQKVLEDTPLPVLVRSRVKKPGVPTWLLAVLLVLGSPVWLPLAVVCGVLILVVYLCIWVVAGCAWITDLSFAVLLPGALVGLVLNAPLDMAQGLFLAGSGLAGAGAAVLLFLPVLALTRLLVRLTAWFGRRCKHLFIRKERG